MVRAVSLAILAATLVATPASTQPYPTISYRDAANHIDKIVWVEGTVLRTVAAAEGTYLYFSNDRKMVALIIPKEYLSNFPGSPGHMYGNKKVKAFGKVQQDGTRLLLAIDGPKKVKTVTQKAT